MAEALQHPPNFIPSAFYDNPARHDYRTLGSEVVESETEAVLNRLRANNKNEQADWLETHVPDPNALIALNPNRLVNRVGRLLGKKVLSKEAFEFASRTTPEDLRETAGWLQSRGEEARQALRGTGDIDHGNQIAIFPTLESARTIVSYFQEKDKPLANQALEKLGLEKTIFSVWAEQKGYKKPTDKDPEVTVAKLLADDVPKSRATQEVKAAKPRDWLSAIKDFTDEQLLNFLQWNVESTRKAQESLDAITPAFRERFSNYIEYLVVQGLLPESARSQLKELDAHRFIAGDVFDTIAKDFGGYHQPGRIVVNMTPLIEKTEDEPYDMETKLIHESLHAITTSTELRDASTWIDEALVQIATNSAVYWAQTDRANPYEPGYYAYESDTLWTSAEANGDPLGTLRSYYDVMFETNPNVAKHKKEQLFAQKPGLDEVCRAYKPKGDIDAWAQLAKQKLA